MRERLDKVLMERGLASSRERAKALIMEGKVLVDDMIVIKAGTIVNESSCITLKESDIPYVSRGGLKLQAAVEHFGIEIQDKIAMDVGASTGGFTDCMLALGASKVYSIDVGYGQFDWGLRHDSRVVLMERTNIRHLPKEAVPDAIDFAAVDVSFISLKTILPKVKEFLKPEGEVVALVKPQFEVGRRNVGKGGIVRDEGKRQEAVDAVEGAASECGLISVGIMQSPIKGQKGNIEYLIYLRSN